MIDFYDLLQISPNAEVETIQRVYHFLAARFHPDNQETGDAGMFRLVNAAYEVLSDQARRAEYDAARKNGEAKPLSASVNFLDNLDGELNRRMAVLAVLYFQRRRSPNTPEVSLREIEERMGFPRDYLDFTLWYLQKRNYITRADNAQYEMTVDGVDFVETERARLPILNRLLTGGSEVPTETVEEEVQELEKKIVGPTNPAPAASPTILHAPMAYILKQRKGPSDRRMGAPDFRTIKTERRRA